MKELLELSIARTTKKKAFIGAVNNPTWEEVQELHEHMNEHYPDPEYIFFNASIWDSDAKEILRPKADASEKTLEQFWDEIQKLLVD
jgi:hypothetical protein